MSFLDDKSLEKSDIVANSRMNRERRAVGVNSYENDLGLNVIEYLDQRLRERGSAAWLDLCCGRGRALIDTAVHFRDQPSSKPVLVGVDLVNMFDDVPPDLDFLRFDVASLHEWNANRSFDLVTCVHGLHYVGDKLGLIAGVLSWLSEGGVFVANLDVASIRDENGSPLGREVSGGLRKSGINYDSRKRLVSCAGRRVLSLDFDYVGANDAAGPNYTGQEAVDSHYRRC